jgi:hypothetical protein
VSPIKARGDSRAGSGGESRACRANGAGGRDDEWGTRKAAALERLASTAANDMRSRKRAAGAILHEAALKRFELLVSGLELRLKITKKTPR